MRQADGRNRRALAADLPLVAGRTARRLRPHTRGVCRRDARGRRTAARNGGAVRRIDPHLVSRRPAARVRERQRDRDRRPRDGGRLSASTDPGHLALVTDGATLAFVSSRDALHLVARTGGGERRIVGKVNEFCKTAPSWSPDGGRPRVRTRRLRRVERHLHDRPRRPRAPEAAQDERRVVSSPTWSRTVDASRSAGRGTASTTPTGATSS